MLPGNAGSFHGTPAADVAELLRGKGGKGKGGMQAIQSTVIKTSPLKFHSNGTNHIGYRLIKLSLKH